MYGHIVQLRNCSLKITIVNNVIKLQFFGGSYIVITIMTIGSVVLKYCKLENGNNANITFVLQGY